MYLVKQLGARKIVDALDAYASSRGNSHGYWTVSPLLRRLADANKDFSDL